MNITIQKKKNALNFTLNTSAGNLSDNTICLIVDCIYNLKQQLTK